ncbi:MULTISPECIES: DMT family transporter [Brucella]|jgi:drug/metabolite transporter (DMT)-like permease|uniref:DMT family transporter n=1 Tax=Brucella/Ochrobactrum group TaxID=2826938 RepID=UPI0009A234AD|nr:MULTISPECIES: DMT family transporter [Brucella]MBO1023908.1 DMT family transporter [Ochrobactrum sp. SD129]MQP38679.1 EamA family transporter [Ochrobactrum sp. MYb237]QWK78538.1 DMT family transporter [Ochrobactrum sp. BTU1]PQZ43296.1 EamA/RhaT family transporter [Brucella pseudogrignonensis]PRA43043.1 EamA/RhaT family transporter [Brucella pseudogrignonensis]
MSATGGGSVQGRVSFDGLAIALVMFIMFTWGLNQVAIKIGNRGFNPMLMAAGRAALGGLCVFLWCYWKRIPLFGRDGTLKPGILAGLLFGVEFVLIFLAMELTSVGRVTLMMNVMPFWVAIGSHFLLGERMSMRAFIGMCVAFLGVFVVFSDHISRPGPNAVYGDLLALISGMLWGMTTLVIKRSKLASAAPEKTLLYQLAVAALVPLPFMSLSGPLIRDPDMLSVLSFLFQSMFVVAVTYPLWFWMVRRYPASKLSNFAFLTPAFGVLLSGLLLNEPLGWKIFAALGLIGLGLIIINRPAKAGAAR